jgi:protein-L-isoaspartate O-methyltransferase
VPRAIHLSAPGIYARCIEHLDLKPGLSFLNVGSGTGYLSAVVASLIGPHAIHHGIELRTSLVELSRTLAAERGLSSIVFHNRSFRAVDPKASMKFDRIWLGAASNAEERTLAAQLLKIGGLCVGPFECESGEQHLSKLERCGAHELLTPADRESELPIRLCWAGDVRVRQTRYLRVSLSPLLRELRELRDVAHDVLAEPHEPLVLLKWMSLQASGASGTEVVRGLMADARFHITNPNSCYSLLGVYAGNAPAFHAADGSGYAFLADAVLQIDAVNAQVAARIVSGFNKFKKMDAGRQALARAQLERLRATGKLSENVGEIVARALA